MGFQGKSNESKGGNNRKYFTGAENFCITTINPNNSELKEKLGFENDQEPNYLSENNGKPQVKISIYLNNVDETNSIKTKVDFFLVNEVKKSTGGKPKYCNKFGQFAYLPADGSIPSNMQWFRTDGKREAIDGEEELVSFLRNYINASKDDDCQIQDIQAFFKGDFSEIKGICDTYPNNKVRVCLGIKSGTDKDGNPRYNQVVYTRKSDRPYAKSNDYLAKDIEEYKANGGAKTTYFGSGSYNLTQIEDPSKLAFFSADSPADLVAGNAGGSSDLPF
jgi:hypothetical protein